MINVSTEADIERLRQVAQLLQAENDRLHHRLLKLTKELSQAQGGDADRLQLELQLLKEQLHQRNQALFGDSSEKRSPGAKKGEEEPAQPRAGHGPKPQPSLPIEEVLFELDEADRMCPKCGGDLVEMAGQFEEADVIDVVSREFRTRSAQNGREALERVAEGLPDLVLTDVMMPEMSGTELCRALKTDPETSAVPVVPVTSKAEGEMKVEGLELGADDYVTKPFHPRELMARVRSLVTQRRLRRELAGRNDELESAMAELESTQVQLVQSERLAAVGELAAGIAHQSLPLVSKTGRVDGPASRHNPPRAE